MYPKNPGLVGMPADEDLSGSLKTVFVGAPPFFTTSAV